MKKFSISIIFALVIATSCNSQISDTITFERPIRLEYPKTETVTVLPSDTSYFCLVVYEDNLSVKMKGKWTQLYNVKQLQRFFDLNHSQIENGKILVIGDPKAKYETYKPIIDIFKKHDYLLFYLAKFTNDKTFSN